MKKNRKFLFDSDSLKNFHKRIFFSILVFLFFFFSVFYRISFITISSYFDNPSQVKLEEKVNRGIIYDRNGEVLAASVESKSLSARPIFIKNSNHLAKELAKIIDIDEDIIKNKLLSGKKFVWLKRNITPSEHQKIIDLGEINLEFHSERKRIYPYKNTLLIL